jgi:hypothetical protein
VPAFEPFDIHVLGAGSRLWLSVHSTLGAVHGVSRPWPTWPQSIAAHGTPTAWLGEVIRRAEREARDPALETGRILTDLALGVPEVSSLFARTRGAAASRNAHVLVRILAAPGEVAAWPWELLLDPQQHNAFLTLSRDAHVVRAPRVRSFAVRKDVIDPPLNLLMILSSPLRSGPSDAETPFDLYQEKRALLEELQPLVDQGLLNVVVEDRPTMDRLRRCMAGDRRGFHLLHYLGHAQQEGLRLEKPSGRGYFIESAKFARVLEQLPDLRLAVFAGCETARAPTSDAGPEWPGQLSTADYVARDSCPLVVGMQAVLPFGTERILTRAFYQALVAGYPVTEALRLARLAVADDDHAGAPLVNWAVPCLFVGTDDLSALVNPAAKAVPCPRPRRIGLRLDVRQRELRFISRLPELRQMIDVLSGRKRARLLLITSTAGTGKTSLADRAIEELESGIAHLFVSVSRLLKADDPVEELASLTAEVMQEAGHAPRARGDLESDQWWERLVEGLTSMRFAIVLDDGEGLLGSDERVVRFRSAILRLAQRRTQSRVAILANGSLDALSSGLDADEVQSIRLEPLAWQDVWQWIRRNLPILTRHDERELAGFYTHLARLEQWEQLAEALADGTATHTTLADIVSRIATRPAQAVQAPPLFGAQEPAVPAPAATPSSRSISVAIAGPYTVGRTAEFARAVTTFSAEHQVSGRVADVNAVDSTASLARLVDLASPFGEHGVATTSAILHWITEAASLGADVLLLDFGALQPSKIWRDYVEPLSADGRLVIAAGGNSGQPTWPAWHEGVLAVGALGEDGHPTEYSPPFPAARKPDVYAPETLAGTSLAEIPNDPLMKGTSAAAMFASAAAIAVWATDRSLSAQEVRSILIETAPTSAPGVRKIDVNAALAHTRKQLLTKALAKGRLTLTELLTATGMRPEVALPLLDDTSAKNPWRRSLGTNVEAYELETEPLGAVSPPASASGS